MDWKRIAIGAGSVGGFVVVVAAGAFAIVSLMPGERQGPTGDNALLMESTPALRPFDEPRRPSPPRPEPADRAVLAERPGPLLPVRPAKPRLSPEELQAEWTNEPAAPQPPPAIAPAPRVPVAPPARSEPPRTMAAAAPPPIVPMRPPAAQAAPLPIVRPPPERRADGVLTPTEIRRIRLSLRLTREQEPHWVPVEQALLEIGAQQAAMVKAGQNPKDAFGVGAAMRMYSVARPLLDVLRDDQKAQIRERARAMGFGNVASNF